MGPDWVAFLMWFRFVLPGYRYEPPWPLLFLRGFALWTVALGALALASFWLPCPTADVPRMVRISQKKACAVAILAQGILGVLAGYVLGVLGGLRGEAMSSWQSRQTAREQAARDFASRSLAGLASSSDARHTPWSRLESIDKLTEQIVVELQALQTASEQAARDFEPARKCHSSFMTSMMQIDNFTAHHVLVAEHWSTLDQTLEQFGKFSLQTAKDELQALQSTLEQAARDLVAANERQGSLQNRMESMKR